MTDTPIAVSPYRIMVRNPSLVRTGEIARLTSLTLNPAYNGVGGFSLTLPAADVKANLITKGGWLSFLSQDSEIMSGQIRGIRLVEDDSNTFGGTYTVYGPSAEQVVADRLAFQVPTSVATAQSGSAYDTRSGAGETVIKQYVNLNAGPGALAARRTTGLVIETDLGRGSSVKTSARMDNLLDLIAPVAQNAGLGFRVVFNSANQLEFRIYVPLDRSGTAKFGTELGNLVSFEQTLEASKSNAVIVGGSGDGTARVFREILDTTAQATWFNRTETFADRRDSADTVELDQAGTEETVTNGPVSGLAIKTVDTPKLMAFRDYFMGDIVSIPEAGITDVLRALTITWTADEGQRTESTVGTASTTGTSKMIKRLADLTAKVAALEAKK